MPKRDHTNEYLEKALDEARRKLPGWAYAMIRSDAEKVEKSHSVTPASGPVGAPIAFVGASPERVDAARGEAIVGPAGETFRDSYLTPLGLSVGEVVKANAVPFLLTDDDGKARQPIDGEVEEWREWLAKELDQLKPRIVVALGQTAKAALGDRADFVLPHPLSIRRKGNRGEVSRKLRQIKKALEAPLVNIAKADEEKQIVYGVVLSSYGDKGHQVDAHNDWTPPGEIEKTAHDWFDKSRKIGILHPGMKGFKSSSDSKAVESHIEEYPAGEYAKAMRGEPHKAIKRKFGTDVAYSGDWILGAKLGKTSWAEYKAGEFNAFSPEGLGLKTRAQGAVMPAVTFVDPS